MTQHFDAIVIGAGALGASTAWHLARAGRSVALVDRHAIASQTSPRAAGLSAALRPTEFMTRIAVRGIEKLLSFKQDTDIDVGIVQSGSLKLAREGRFARQLADEASRAHAYGVEVREITGNEARTLMPFLDPTRATAINFYPNDVYLDPARFTRGYADAAERLGCALLPHTEVHDVVLDGGAISGVETSSGLLRAPVVVDAAGAWLRSAARPASSLPMMAVRHQLFVTEPLAGIEPGQPITRVLDENVYVRPCDGGLMLGGYESDPMLLEAPPRDVADLPLNLGVLRRLASRVATEFPIIETAGVAQYRGGMPTMTMDDEHVVGPVPEVPGFYVIGGCNVGGLSTAPALGEALSEIILGGSTGAIAPLLPERLARREISPDALREACHAHYAQHYWSETARADQPVSSR